MELGFFTMPIHRLERDYVTTLKEDREAFIIADRLGFSEGFVGEHVTDAAETITSSMIFIASLVSETRRIKLGTGTSNLTHSHPVLIAAQAAMLDHMLEGRFLFGVSPGALASDAEALGILDMDRGAMFAEAIDHILDIWAGAPPYDLDGRFHRISTARTFDLDLGMGIIAKPFQKPHPPILGTVVAPYSKGVIEMGKRGFMPISANFLQPNWVATHWANYAEGCAEGGRPADPADWRIARSIFVCDDENTARAYGGAAPDSPYRFYYSQLLAKLTRTGRHGAFKIDPDMPDEALTLDFILDSLVIQGGVSSVVDQILALREQVGDFGTLLYAGKDWTDPDLARRSMELMANEVMPAVNQAISSSAAAQ